LEEYSALFSIGPQHKAIGEICPLYLYDRNTPDRIHRYVPNVKLIAMLRHPADRAFSAYKMLVETGREPLRDFERALDEEERRIAAHWEHAWHYVGMGRYHEQLSRYYDRFGRHQIRVYLHEDFERSPRDTLRSICEFIGVDPALAPPVEGRQNVSRLPKSERIERILRSSLLRAAVRPIVPAKLRSRVRHTLHRLNTTEADVPHTAKRRITGQLEGDIRKLEELIQRDLSSWLSPLSHDVVPSSSPTRPRPPGLTRE
jgi:hypothetical protein